MHHGVLKNITLKEGGGTAQRESKCVCVRECVKVKCLHGYSELRERDEGARGKER